MTSWVPKTLGWYALHPRMRRSTIPPLQRPRLAADDRVLFRAWRWRLAAALLFGGALAGAVKSVSALPSTGSALAAAVSGLLSCLAGLYVLARRERIRDGWYVAVGLLGVVVLTVATYREGLDGTVAADNVLFYLWPVVFCGAFLPGKWMWVQVVAACAGYCVLLALEVEPSAALGRGFTAVLTLAGCGWVVASLRDHAAAALMAVEEQSQRDPLTGLLNRRGLARGLDALLERSAAPVATLLCDLDRFKALNDVHGHEAGDEALRRVAAMLEQTAGDDALVARQGGEEFVVVAPVVLEEATALAERVRLAVRTGSGDHPPLTISIGVAASPPWEPTLPALLRSADKALYRAKATGRDRVEVEGFAPLTRTSR